MKVSLTAREAWDIRGAYAEAEEARRALRAAEARLEALVALACKSHGAAPAPHGSRIDISDDGEVCIVGGDQE